MYLKAGFSSLLVETGIIPAKFPNYPMSILIITEKVLQRIYTPSLSLSRSVGALAKELPTSFLRLLSPSRSISSKKATNGTSSLEHTDAGLCRDGSPSLPLVCLHRDGLPPQQSVPVSADDDVRQEDEGNERDAQLHAGDQVPGLGGALQQEDPEVLGGGV